MNLENIIEKIGNNECLDAEENRFLLRLFRDSKNQAQRKVYQDILVLGNLGLVKMECFKYRSFFQFREEIYQEACEALILAIKKYNLEKDTAFSTFACAVISRKLSDYIININRLIKIPRSVYSKTKTDGTQENQKDLLPITIAADIVDTMDMEELVVKKDQIDRMLAGLMLLDPIEQHVIIERYGLASDGKMVSLKELGQKYGMDANKIYRWINRILKKLRAYM